MKAEEKRRLSCETRLDSLKEEEKNLLSGQRENKEDILENEEQVKRLTEKRDARIVDKQLVEDIPMVQEKLTRLINARNEIEDLEKSKHQKQQQYEKKGGELKKRQAEFQKLRTGAGNLAAKKDEIESTMSALTENTSLALLEKQCRFRTTRIARYKDMLRIAEKHEKMRIEKEKPEERISQLEKTLSGMLVKNVALARRYEKEASECLIMEKKSHQDHFLAAYDKARGNLKEGCECPLCGARNHPFLIDGLPVSGTSPKQIAKKKRIMKSIRNDARRLEEKITKLRTQRAGAIERLETCQKKLWLLAGEWESLCRKNNESRSMESTVEIKMEIKRFKNEEKKLKQRIKAIRNQARKREKLLIEWNKIKEKPIKKQQEILVSEGWIRKIRTELSRIERDLSESSAGEKEAENDLMSLLSVYGETVPEKNREKLLMRNLTDRWKAFCHYEADLRQARKNGQNLTENTGTFTADLAEVKKEAESVLAQRTAIEKIISDLNAQRTSRYDDKNPVREIRAFRNQLEECRKERKTAIIEYEKINRALTGRRDLYQVKKIERKKLTEQTRQLEASVTGRMKEAGFEQMAQIKESILPIEQIRHLEQTISETDSRIELSRIKMEAARKEVEGAGMAVTQKDMEDYLSEQDRLSSEKERVDTEIAKKQNLLREQHRLQRMGTDLETQIATLKQESVRWNLLDGLKSTDSGYAFRKAAQTLTLDALLDQSNRHLNTLSGRYHICRHESRELDLEILDLHYKKSGKRSVKRFGKISFGRGKIPGQFCHGIGAFRTDR